MHHDTSNEYVTVCRLLQNPIVRGPATCIGACGLSWTGKAIQPMLLVILVRHTETFHHTLSLHGRPSCSNTTYSSWRDPIDGSCVGKPSNKASYLPCTAQQGRCFLQASMEHVFFEKPSLHLQGISSFRRTCLLARFLLWQLDDCSLSTSMDFVMLSGAEATP